MAIYAEVIINSDAVQVDRPFTYKVREEIKYEIFIGHRVLIPFGKGNKSIEGFVIDVYEEEKQDKIRYKYITKLCDEEPLLSKEKLEMVKFVKNKYLCKYIDAIRIMIPPKIMSGNKAKVKKVITYKHCDKNIKKNYLEALELIKNNSGIFNKAELTSNLNISSYMINKLLELGFIDVINKKIDRIDDREFENYSEKKLNEEQLLAYNRILNTNKKVCLLKGITGSGKTEVYMKLVKTMLENNKTSLILVPEIALTPQMIERFKGRFGRNVAVFHSRLSDGERYDEWYRVYRGDVKLVIGARSALFLPFKNLGLIVVDEEHEASYKSEQNPKYNTIEVCNFIADKIGCKVVLGSATPGVESYYRSLMGEYELVELKNRANNAVMPEITVVDMREELKEQNKSMFSRVLFNNIKETLERKEQIILFLNRRGFSTFVSCRSCGYVFKCDNCDIAMTYHKNNSLTCHYCGETKVVPKICPKCKSKYVKYFGTGTEKVEEAIKYYFKDARILRMDVDTTRLKGSHEKIYNSFKNGKADILIGTQMIAKGLDFANVTLVGVLAADTTLNLPDYKASERTFQIITQVSGRAGRGEKSGKVIIQTYSPEHYAIIYSKENNYEQFFKEEISIRKNMEYPPFTNILLINLSCENEDKLIKFSKNLGRYIKSMLDLERDLEIYDPCASIIGKIKRMYRWQILIKGNITENIANDVKKGVYEFSKDVYNDIKISLDLNPNSLI